MDTIALRAYAKINIGLDVLRKRTDGYHDIKTLMHNISLYDELVFYKNEKCEIKCDRAELTDVGSNIISRVTEALRGHFGIKESMGARLIKRIPMQAGLGGGSADGAAAAYAFCRLYSCEYSPGRLSSLLAQIGADIPFFLYGGCCLCEGIGEIVTPQAQSRSWPCVIVKPRFFVNTRLAYASIDADVSRARTDFDSVLAMLAAPRRGVCAQHTTLGNDFEAYVAGLSTEIDIIKNELEKRGAFAAGLSGSGSAMYGLFTEKDKAAAAAEALANGIAGSQVFTCSLCSQSMSEI